MDGGLNVSTCGNIKDSPCKTIIYACERAIDTHTYPKTVIVMCGVYIEEVPFTVIGDLIIVGEDVSTCILSKKNQQQFTLFSLSTNHTSLTLSHLTLALTRNTLSYNMVRAETPDTNITITIIYCRITMAAGISELTFCWINVGTVLGTITLEHCDAYNIKTTGQYGFIYSPTTLHTLTLTDSAFRNLTTTATNGRGGWFCVTNASRVLITRCVFAVLLQEQSVGIGYVKCLTGNGNSSNLEMGLVPSTDSLASAVSGCVFSNCTTTNVNSGFYISTPSLPGITPAILFFNISILFCTQSQGGFIYILNSTNVSLTACTFYRCVSTNITDGVGGAVFLSGDCWAVFERCVFYGCRASHGGAVYLNKDVVAVVMQDVMFLGNTAEVIAYDLFESSRSATPMFTRVCSTLTSSTNINPGISYYKSGGSTTQQPPYNMCVSSSSSCSSMGAGSPVNYVCPLPCAYDSVSDACVQPDSCPSLPLFSPPPSSSMLLFSSSFFSSLSSSFSDPPASRPRLGLHGVCTSLCPFFAPEEDEEQEGENNSSNNSNSSEGGVVGVVCAAGCVHHPSPLFVPSSQIDSSYDDDYDEFLISSSSSPHESLPASVCELLPCAMHHSRLSAASDVCVVQACAERTPFLPLLPVGGGDSSSNSSASSSSSSSFPPFFPCSDPSDSSSSGGSADPSSSSSPSPTSPSSSSPPSSLPCLYNPLRAPGSQCTLAECTEAVPGAHLTGHVVDGVCELRDCTQRRNISADVSENVCGDNNNCFYNETKNAAGDLNCVEECVEDGLYASTPVDGRCVLKECGQRVPSFSSSSPSFPCGGDGSDCFLIERDGRCTETCPADDGHHTGQTDTTTGRCVMRSCVDRTPLFVIVTTPLSPPPVCGDNSKCFFRRGRAEGKQCSEDVCVADGHYTGETVRGSCVLKACKERLNVITTTAGDNDGGAGEMYTCGPPGRVWDEDDGWIDGNENRNDGNGNGSGSGNDSSNNYNDNNETMGCFFDPRMNSENGFKCVEECAEDGFYTGKADKEGVCVVKDCVDRTPAVMTTATPLTRTNPTTGVGLLLSSSSYHRTCRVVGSTDSSNSNNGSGSDCLYDPRTQRCTDTPCTSDGHYSGEHDETGVCAMYPCTQRMVNTSASGVQRCGGGGGNGGGEGEGSNNNNSSSDSDNSENGCVEDPWAVTDVGKCKTGCSGLKEHYKAVNGICVLRECGEREAVLTIRLPCGADGNWCFYDPRVDDDGGDGDNDDDDDGGGGVSGEVGGGGRKKEGVKEEEEQEGGGGELVEERKKKKTNVNVNVNMNVKKKKRNAPQRCTPTCGGDGDGDEDGAVDGHYTGKGVDGWCEMRLCEQRTARPGTKAPCGNNTQCFYNPLALALAVACVESCAQIDSSIGGGGIGSYVADKENGMCVWAGAGIGTETETETESVCSDFKTEASCNSGVVAVVVVDVVKESWCEWVNNKCVDKKEKDLDGEEKEKDDDDVDGDDNNNENNDKKGGTGGSIVTIIVVVVVVVVVVAVLGTVGGTIAVIIVLKKKRSAKGSPDASNNSDNSNNSNSSSSKKDIELTTISEGGGIECNNRNNTSVTLYSSQVFSQAQIQARAMSSRKSTIVYERPNYEEEDEDREEERQVEAEAVVEEFNDHLKKQGINETFTVGDFKDNFVVDLEEH